MRYPRLVLLSFLICVASLVLSGCGSAKLMSSGSSGGATPVVFAVGDQVNGVAPNRKQEVQFNEAMNPATINSQSLQVGDSTGKLAQGAVSYDPDFNTASFLPDPALQSGATYTATITTAAASADGAHLANPYSYTFSTRSDSDTSPLMINSVDPTANAPCVSATPTITITFDEAPDVSTVTPGNLMVTGPNGAIPVKISTSVATTQVVLTPVSPLPSGAITVTVSSNVADLAGVKMAAPYTWTFSTACSGGGGGGSNTFVYAGDNINIAGFEIAADGSVSAIPGSPFALAANALAASPSGDFLFGDGQTGPGTGMAYYTYSVAANGSLSTASSTTQVPNSPDTGAAPFVLGWVTTDRTGTTLYGSVSANGPPGPGNQWTSEYAIGPTGSLSLLGAGVASNMPPMSFTPDDRFAYYVWSVPGSPSLERGITALVRNSDGTLSLSRSTTLGGFPVPAGLPLESLPENAAVAPNSNFLALTWTFGGDGITVYSIGSDGSINNPTPFLALPAGEGSTMAWDSTGAYLFVSGQGFYFGNGDIYVVRFDSTANRVSMVSTTRSAADLFMPQMSFLNGHLFVVNRSDQSLYVYNFANGVLTPAPGSPVPLGFNPSSLAAVQR